MGIHTTKGSCFFCSTSSHANPYNPEPLPLKLRGYLDRRINTKTATSSLPAQRAKSLDVVTCDEAGWSKKCDPRVYPRPTNNKQAPTAHVFQHPKPSPSSTQPPQQIEGNQDTMERRPCGICMGGKAKEPSFSHLCHDMSLDYTFSLSNDD